jgi:hypothetical protein
MILYSTFKFYLTALSINQIICLYCSGKEVGGSDTISELPGRNWGNPQKVSFRIGLFQAEFRTRSRSATYSTTSFGFDITQECGHTYIRTCSCKGDTGWKAGVPFLSGARGFSVFRSAQYCSGAHQASYWMVMGDHFLGKCLEPTTRLRLMPRSRMEESCFHSPVSLHGVVFNCWIN